MKSRGAKRLQDLIGEEGLLKHLTRLVVERALEAGMTEHLGHGSFEPQLIARHQTRWAGFDDKIV